MDYSPTEAVNLNDSGFGAFATVALCRHKVDGSDYAVKKKNQPVDMSPLIMKEFEGNASSPILGFSPAVLQVLCVEAMKLALSLEKSTNEKLCSTCSVR
ncbi:hypothetical protein C1H46_003331 [Malus baccata]|uniref:Protein kinase domain-containing protein n=1 Tax=Malus baccata TaxID=106549 RepID=A0A540NJ62_MALBA|nr:hypothetical protein C1H46_003331 [Malus baccata]